MEFDPDDAPSWEPDGHDFGRAGASANPAAVHGVEYGVVTGAFQCSTVVGCSSSSALGAILHILQFLKTNVGSKWSLYHFCLAL